MRRIGAEQNAQAARYAEVPTVATRCRTGVNRKHGSTTIPQRRSDRHTATHDISEVDSLPCISLSDCPTFSSPTPGPATGLRLT